MLENRKYIHPLYMPKNQNILCKGYDHLQSAIHIEASASSHTSARDGIRKMMIQVVAVLVICLVAPAKVRRRLFPLLSSLVLFHIDSRDAFSACRTRKKPLQLPPPTSCHCPLQMCPPLVRRSAIHGLPGSQHPQVPFSLTT